MINVISPSAEIWKQDGYTLDAIWKHIARCARVCYQSTPKNNDESDYDFLVRTLFKGHDILKEDYTNEDIVRTHLSVCEHGTVHLKYPLFIPDYDKLAIYYKLCRNRYTKHHINGTYNYITTNMRVLIENFCLAALKFIDTTPNCPYYTGRYTVSFIADVGVSRELNRHRVNSVSEESTRYCAYDKGKFGNGISVIKLPWIPDIDSTNEGHDYTEGFFNYNEICYDNIISEQYVESWIAVDWFLYGLQICDLVYHKTRQLGWTAQQAREILPLNTKTQVVHTAFADDWKHLINLRSNEVSGKVHPVMKELTNQLIKLINK